MMADGFCLAKWLGLQHGILRDLFCPYCRLSHGVPLWLLKRQDIYVSLTNFWSLVSADGGKKQKTNQPPLPLNEFQAWAGAHGHDMLPSIQVCKWAAAAQLCLEEPWEWQSQDSGSCWLCWSLTSWRGSNPISWMLFFQKYQQCRFCCFKFWRFTHDDAIPRCVCLRGGFLLHWVKQGGEPKPVAASQYLQAASPLFPCPEDTAFVSVTGLKNWCLETCLTQVLLHFSPAFVFMPWQPAKSYFLLTQDFGGD